MLWCPCRRLPRMPPRLPRQRRRWRLLRRQSKGRRAGTSSNRRSWSGEEEGWLLWLKAGGRVPTQLDAQIVELRFVDGLSDSACEKSIGSANSGQRSTIWRARRGTARLKGPQREPPDFCWRPPPRPTSPLSPALADVRETVRNTTSRVPARDRPRHLWPPRRRRHRPADRFAQAFGRRVSDAVRMTEPFALDGFHRSSP